MKQVTMSFVWMVVLACAAGGYYAFACHLDSIPVEPNVPVVTVAKCDCKPAELPPGLEPDLITAWEKRFAARVGWYGLDELSGCWHFSTAKPKHPDALPAFGKVGFQPGRIG